MVHTLGGWPPGRTQPHLPADSPLPVPPGEVRKSHSKGRGYDELQEYPAGHHRPQSATPAASLVHSGQRPRGAGAPVAASSPVPVRGQVKAPWATGLPNSGSSRLQVQQSTWAQALFPQSQATWEGLQAILGGQTPRPTNSRGPSTPQLLLGTRHQLTLKMSRVLLNPLWKDPALEKALRHGKRNGNLTEAAPCCTWCPHWGSGDMCPPACSSGGRQPEETGLRSQGLRQLQSG